MLKRLSYATVRHIVTIRLHCIFNKLAVISDRDMTAMLCGRVGN